MYCYTADGGATLLKPAAKQKNVDLYSILFDSAELFGHFGLLVTPREQFQSSFVWGCAQKEALARNMFDFAHLSKYRQNRKIEKS